MGHFPPEARSGVSVLSPAEFMRLYRAGLDRLQKGTPAFSVSPACCRSLSEPLPTRGRDLAIL